MKNSQKIKNIFVYFTILLFSLWIPAVRFSWSIPPVAVQIQVEKERERNRTTIIILYAENLPQSSTPPAVLLAGGVICTSDDCHTLSHRSGRGGVWRNKSAFDAVSCAAALNCTSSMRGGKFSWTAKELCPHRGSKQKVILHKIKFLFVHY